MISTQILSGDYTVMPNGNALLRGEAMHLDGSKSQWTQEVDSAEVNRILSSSRKIKTFTWNVDGWLNTQRFTGTKVEYDEFRASINY